VIIDKSLPSHCQKIDCQHESDAELLCRAAAAGTKWYVRFSNSDLQQLVAMSKIRYAGKLFRQGQDALLCMVPTLQGRTERRSNHHIFILDGQVSIYTTLQALDFGFS